MRGTLDDWGRSLISLIVVIGFFGILVLLLKQKLEGNAAPDVLLVLLGALGQAFGQVISYWVGSSSGSKQKDDTIKNIAEKTP